MVPVNYLAVLAAAAVSVVLGFLWYGPLFGKIWIALAGFSKADMDAAKNKSMAGSYFLTFLGSLVMSYVLAYVLVFASSYTNASGASAGLMSAFWIWLGFIAPVTLNGVLWEGKSWKMWFLNNGYSLVSLCLMGIILAVWR